VIVALDVAFPRIISFFYWGFLVGGIFFVPLAGPGPSTGVPNRGWFGYTRSPARRSASMVPARLVPTSGPRLVMLGIGSTTSAINFIVLSLTSGPVQTLCAAVFLWMMLVVAFPDVSRFPNHYPAP